PASWQPAGRPGAVPRAGPRAHARLAGRAPAGSGRVPRRQPGGRAPDQPGGAGGGRRSQHRQAGRGSAGARRRRRPRGNRTALRRSPGPRRGRHHRAIDLMLQTVACTTDRRRLKAPFRISRGVKTEIETVRVTIAREGVAGVGAATPYPRYGESAASAAAQVESIRRELEAGLGRRRLLDLLPPGAARNAVDCALWDLEARSAGVGVADLIGAARPRRCETAMTVSLDTPGRMEAAAARLASAPLLKVKVDGRDPEGQIAAVRRVAPAPRLIVDPNEGWDFATLKALQPCLREARVDLVEQPLPAAADEVLEGWP